MAIKRIQAKNAFGLLKDGTETAFYHPLPRTYKDQEKWCKDIIKIINK